MKLGSLFSGYGGLEMGIEQVMPAETAWHVEFDAAPSRILTHHWPDVPNYGDITTVNWAQVEPVDILCGGFPCQDVSLAGLRKGLHSDTRSGLWSHFALAIDALRPPYVIVENVRGLLSAQAASNLEPDAWDLGDRSVRPPLRALGAVLGDLADLGYDTQWAGVRAADAGAPHGRFRVFLVAYPAGDRPVEVDAGDDGIDEQRPQIGRRAVEPARLGGDRLAVRRDTSGSSAAGLGTAARIPTDGREPDADPDGERHGRREDPRMVGRLDRHHESPPRERERPLTRDRSAEAPEDADVATRDQRGIAAPGQAPTGRPRPDTRRRGGAPVPDAVGSGRTGGPSEPLRGPLDGTAPAWRREVDWGVYEPAIRRWENVTGRLAPSPTEVGSKGGHSLSTRFVEWLMGLNPGHVTDPTIGLTRNEQLKALGNGVVPQQAALALTRLLNRTPALEGAPA